jgi:hypothetical protein
MSWWRRLWPGILFVVVVSHAPALSAQVWISGLSDLHFGSWGGAGDLQGELEHCVLGPRGGRFAIEATGDGPGGAFVLDSGPASLPFEVAYDDGSGWNQMQPGVPLTGQIGEPNQNQFNRCLSGQRPPERVRVRVLAQDLGVAVGGSYGGSLTLLVTPE